MCPTCSDDVSRPEERPAKRQRLSNRHKCDGRCRKGKGCKHVAASKYDLDKHQGKHKTQCPVDTCKQIYSTKGDMVRHYRKAHKELLNEDGSSKQHPEIKAKRSSPIFIPERFKARVDKATWEQLHDKGGYAFLVQMVRTSIHRDLDNKNFKPADIKYCKSLDNERIHKIAQEILHYLIDHNMLTPGAKDEAGGCLPNGFVLKPHGGVFALGLDRRDNELPHFPKDGTAIGPDSNLRVVVKAINTRANIVVDYGAETCARLRQAMLDPVTDADLNAAWLREQDATTRKNNGKKVHNAAYNSCKSSYQRDKLCKAAFPDINAFFRHCLELWAQQGLLCALSGILLQGKDCEDSFFKMSLDAIDPTKGHVPENLRWVCQGLNSTNRDKDKRVHCEDDLPSEWNRERLAAYVGVELSQIRVCAPFAY